MRWNINFKVYLRVVYKNTLGLGIPSVFIIQFCKFYFIKTTASILTLKKTSDTSIFLILIYDFNVLKTKLYFWHYKLFIQNFIK